MQVHRIRNWTARDQDLQCFCVFYVLYPVSNTGPLNMDAWNHPISKHAPQKLVITNNKCRMTYFLPAHQWVQWLRAISVYVSMFVVAAARQIFSQQSFLYACAMRVSLDRSGLGRVGFQIQNPVSSATSQHNSRNPNQHLMICDVTVRQLTSVDPQLLSMANRDFLAT